jgi:hypothetical protein
MRGCYECGVRNADCGVKEEITRREQDAEIRRSGDAEITEFIGFIGFVGFIGFRDSINSITQVTQ